MTHAKLINISAGEPVCITPEDYRRIRADITARLLAGASEPGDKVLAELLLNGESRYWELRAGEGDEHERQADLRRKDDGSPEGSRHAVRTRDCQFNGGRGCYTCR